MNKSRNLQILAWAIIIYMLMAMVWWSILLNNKNQLLYQYKMELLAFEESQSMPIPTEQLQSLESYQQLLEEYKAQKRMIYGEASVFGIILLIGLWMINHAYQQEIKAVQRQKNFLLSITHELKSPIASIKLILDTFIKRKLSDKQLKNFSKDALSEINRLNQLVNNLLTSSKIESDYSYNFENTDLVQSIWDLLDYYSEKHPDFSISRKSDIEKINLPLDKEAINMVFTNIIENAIKYSDEIKELHVEITSLRNKVKITFADKGIGVPSGEQNKVFEKFYRVGSEETRKSQGTGLGLFIARHFVLAHRGNISLRANKPKGSIVSIVLPLKAK